MSGGGFSSSKEFPDEVLRFVRSHPVMYRPVLPQYNRPVLLQTEPGRRKLTQIAVDRVQAQDGHYHVLYIGTGTSRSLPVGSVVAGSGIAALPLACHHTHNIVLSFFVFQTIPWC